MVHRGDLSDYCMWTSWKVCLTIYQVTQTHRQAIAKRTARLVYSFVQICFSNSGLKFLRQEFQLIKLSNFSCLPWTEIQIYQLSGDCFTGGKQKQIWNPLERSLNHLLSLLFQRRKKNQKELSCLFRFCVRSDTAACRVDLQAGWILEVLHKKLHRMCLSGGYKLIPWITISSSIAIYQQYQFS